MIRRPPRSTQGVSSAASDVYKRQVSTQSTWDISPVSKSDKFFQARPEYSLNKYLFSTKSTERKNVYKMLVRQLIRQINDEPQEFENCLAQYGPDMVKDFSKVRTWVYGIQSVERTKASNSSRNYAKLMNILCSNPSLQIILNLLLHRTYKMIEEDQCRRNLASKNKNIYKATINDLLEHTKKGIIELLGKYIPLCDAGSLSTCLLYTSPSPRDLSTSRMPSSA
eukprot:TRINITY_DN232_c0_g1_i2.p1 TRINITY_DN232_c0_g1~~TRINITY_DN232_c0_g1_i2.p1  ORF type:complete len:224 (+),score=49.03 TRINITY_DN232_c0_g1_i2:109-780(+)